MNKKQIMEQYRLWMKEAQADIDIAEELQNIARDEAKIEDAFYRDLGFGTGGLRGVIGAGTNRVNIYTVAKASQGVADYVNKHFSGERKIAIGYDSRVKSDLFARMASGVFAANGINVLMYEEIIPTPCLSFAVRRLNCAAGIMITASHNPAEYNGYKVYDADGCQITIKMAKEILVEIEKLDIFKEVRSVDFDEGIRAGSIEFISGTIYTEFIEEVKRQSMLGSSQSSLDKASTIVYTPLNGTGLKPVLRTLTEMGYTNVTVVKEQEEPDGHFPTCPQPNPENVQAMTLGIEYAKKNHAGLLLATDPDCDRIGIAVKNKDGEYVLLSGNETGVLLLDYICSQHKKRGTMPTDPVMIKTIVTTDMAERIAAHFGVRTINTLTGFKFIGEQIGLLESEGKSSSYIFGFEESCGYLSGAYVRDKDAVGGALLICEMFSYYKAKGVTLLQRLEELYQRFGFGLNTLYSFEFQGETGSKNMQRIMELFRREIHCLGGKNVLKRLDYAKGVDGLPKSDVLKFVLDGSCSVVVRPSGTEPKLKVYTFVSADSWEEATRKEEEIAKSLKRYIV
ncbi:MAG: phospho-sugar mutase [Christensenella sp.]|uniref:phospho-sugar mutase n=1 Tax=Christensenella sp. TaxID=1935934 RepID=UPI002B1ECA39|nr:phospho-sugar mutase [Christensenella sp.]MEA5003655.1 phospho-sugar mutase [Christensenella sp.]